MSDLNTIENGVSGYPRNDYQVSDEENPLSNRPSKDDGHPSNDEHDKEKRHSKRHRRSLRARLKDSTEFKRQTFYALENIRKGNPAAKIIGSALFFLIVANAAAVFISVEPGINIVANSVVDIFFKFSTVCFTMEYIARVWIADLVFSRRTHLRSRIRYIFSPMGIIDFLSFAPSIASWFLPVTPALMHAIGVIRLVRLAKITRYMRGFRTIGRVFRKHYREIVAAFLVIILLIIAASIVMFEIENPAQPDKFDSLLSGIWWAVETVTGTGYGDIVPITAPGRIVGSVIMLLALALVAIPGGIFSAGFVAEYQNVDLRRIEKDVNKKDIDKENPEE